jgi:hypothetical protein
MENGIFVFGLLTEDAGNGGSRTPRPSGGNICRELLSTISAKSFRRSTLPPTGLKESSRRCMPVLLPC